MSLIFLNAAAIRSSGALTILRDCIHYLESNPRDKAEYHLCTVVNNFNSSKNVEIHKIKPQNWLARIIWDNGGLQKWCRRNNIEPNLIISLQNTSTKFINKDGKSIPQLVYYHQPLPLIQYKWNVLKRQELKLFLYTHFYSFFVARNSKSSYYVVQLSYIRELFLKKFKRVNRERVFVIRPDDPVIDIDGISRILLDKEKFYFFYPSTVLKYKNHKIIVQALVLLRQTSPSVLDNIKVIFTIDKFDSQIMKLIGKYNLLDIIQFIGQKLYDEVLSYYKSVDALLFPSQIETFGLPLAEASRFGLPIIAADLPYAAEVLEKYSNKVLIDSESVGLWADAIKNYQTYKTVCPPPPPPREEILGEHSLNYLLELLRIPVEGILKLFNKLTFLEYATKIQ